MRTAPAAVGRRGGGLTAELPARFDEVTQGRGRLEDEDLPEFLDAEAQAGLHLDHLHEGFTPTGPLRRPFRSRYRRQQREASCHIAEHRVAGRP